MSTSINALPRKLVKRVQRTNAAKAIELASRLGYAARGLVYLGLGTVVLLAALDLTPRAKGAKGMLRAWADWPLGWALIGAIGVGLAGFAAWRVLQAVFDADRHGRTLKAWAVRAGQAFSGLVYGGLALSAFELLDELEDVGEVDEEQSVHHAARAVLDLPYGDALLIAAGLAVVAFAVGNVVQGLMQDFSKRLDCDDKTCRRVVPLAKAGYGARGLASLPLGVFLVMAGLQARAGEARSWGGALQAIEHQPFGSGALVLVAAGLIAFGLFGLVEARYRRIRPPPEVTP
ncbi:DUF1206 domain-containing protein [Caulobacter sp. UNC358MFTsu5.1]|uniref:DUF1206 domain-containing protein n=1 Tax=Caulobacter sp. UNC358MFTsu5.1 TaxID=1449049 RepID=UPI0004A77361|nr:DUF1206 domain-containing protein [Caulobacter sp. UNC358MFTsu5.1]